MLRCDNLTVVSHFNKEGKIKFFLLSCIVWEITQWSISKDLMIRAAHISGRKNLLAVDLSKGRLGVWITIEPEAGNTESVLHSKFKPVCYERE